MAPEVDSGEVHDPKKADFFSLGVILFVMATCSFPFRVANLGDRFYHCIAFGDLDAFWLMHESTSDGKELPESLKHLITSLLSDDPEERPDFGTI